MTIRSGKAFFNHKDHLGSVVAITNDAGEVIQKNQYSSFGKILSIKNKDRKEVGVEGAVEKSFVYTGREWDEEIGLYYYRARHYDPQTGRFMSPDPIGLAGGDTNLFRYVKNNPIKYTDPSGLIVFDMTGGLISQAIKAGELYRWLDAHPTELVYIYSDPSLPVFGDASRAGQNTHIVRINPIRNHNPAELYDTIIHELNHARLNIQYDYSTSEEFDTDGVLPSVIKQNPPAISCGG